MDAAAPVLNLRPIKSTAFKREERRKRKERKKQEKLAESLSLWDPLCSNQSRPSHDHNPVIQVSATPWPCDLIASPPKNPEWVEWAPFVAPKPATLSDEGSCRTVQADAIRICQEFLGKGEDEEEIEDCMVDDDEEEEEEEDANGLIFEFFSDLFENNEGLKRYYEERKEEGDLICLVCEKKFTSCMGLVQHANTIKNTKRRFAHRVYWSTMNRVLGLETDKIEQLVDNKDANLVDSEYNLDGFVMADMDT